MIELIDSHAHISSKDFSDIPSLLERAKKNNISSIINVCTDLLSLEESFLLEKNYPFIFSAAATTPHDVEKEGEIFFPIVERYAREKKLVAIGETGLDYYYTHSKKEIQKKYFLRYASLAKELGLPLIIHCRDAFSDLFDLSSSLLPFRAVLHCFTGSREEAKKALDYGWLISFSGIVTYKNSHLPKLIKDIPLEKMLIETDSPYLAPQKHRGHKNEPSFLIETAKAIALLKEISLEKLSEITARNAKELFQLS